MLSSVIGRNANFAIGRSSIYQRGYKAAAAGGCGKVGVGLLRERLSMSRPDGISSRFLVFHVVQVY